MPAARHAFPAVATIAVLTLTAGAAHAQGSDLNPGDYEVRLGAGVLIGPVYPGSETTEASPVPILDVAYRAALPMLDTIFLNTRDGLGIVAFRHGPFSIGGGIGYATGRDEDDAARLRGMGNIDGAPRASLFLRGEFGALTVSLRGQHAMGDQEGTTVTLGASYRQQITPDFSLTGNVEAVWADQDSMQQWFGVDSLQAGRSGMRAYRPGSGMRSATLSLTAGYALSEHWSLHGTAGVSRLLGDAADSPVTEEKTQPFGLLGFSYRF
jgi:outer membrane scaffolding protein for murein synthesis (MipA/OmpV family)